MRQSATRPPRWQTGPATPLLLGQQPTPRSASRLPALSQRGHKEGRRWTRWRARPRPDPPPWQIGTRPQLMDCQEVVTRPSLVHANSTGGMHTRRHRRMVRLPTPSGDSPASATLPHPSRPGQNAFLPAKMAMGSKARRSDRKAVTRLPCHECQGVLDNRNGASHSCPPAQSEFEWKTQSLGLGVAQLSLGHRRTASRS